MTRYSLEWIRAQSRSFFLFVNFPSDDPTGELIDRGLGALLEQLDSLGRYDDTMLVVAVPSPGTSSGSAEVLPPAASGLFEAALRHEIYVKYPRVLPPSRRGRKLVHRVDSLDLHASILRELGLARETDRTRTPGVEANAPGRYGLNEPRPYHFAETDWGDSELEAVYHEQWKLVRDGRGGRWLFDLVRDPGETTSLLEQHDSIGMRLFAVLDAWTDSDHLLSPRDGTGHYPPTVADLMPQ